MTVIIPAGGTGSRIGGTPKQFRQLDGTPILRRVLDIFARQCTTIIVAVPAEYIQTVHSWNTPATVIQGGETRAHSVYACLQALQIQDNSDEIILIHDAARPHVSQDTITAVAAATRNHGAAIAAIKITDTVKQTDENGIITRTIPRDSLWRAATPQGFTAANLHRMYSTGGWQTATDDAQLAERLHIPVKIIPCEAANIKITTAEDLPPPAADSTQLQIFTDGACSGNPGAGGWGAILIKGTHRREIYGGEPETTNNRMELMAAIQALKALKRPSTVTLTSDSRYMVDAITKGWARKWQANSWMRNKKEAALNPDLWEELLALTKIHDVTFKWIRGHDGHPENERADQLARQGIVAQ
jgi:ribonuclease HI